MVHLELTSADAQILRTVLESYLSDLRMEISHTDSFDFREGLKERKEALLRVVQELEGAAA